MRKKIELIIQKEEDIVFLIQGLNWIRRDCIESTKKIFQITEGMKKPNSDKMLKAIDEHVSSHDRLMSLIAQLDKHLEDKTKGPSKSP